MGTTEGTCFLVGYRVGFLLGSRFLLMRPSGTTSPGPNVSIYKYARRSGTVNDEYNWVAESTQMSLLHSATAVVHGFHCIIQVKVELFHNQERSC